MKGDFTLKHVAQQQGLVVSRNNVDEEVMALQSAALQRGEKFKESEVLACRHSESNHTSMRRPDDEITSPFPPLNNDKTDHA